MRGQSVVLGYAAATEGPSDAARAAILVQTAAGARLSALKGTRWWG